MAVYYKPQSPIQSGEDFVYPITTADQIMKSDNSRRLEQAGLIVADNSTSLGGVAAEDYALKTDTAPDSSKLGGKTMAQLLLTVYPVGSIYLSVNSTSPASLFGGTWESIGGRFLLGADATYAAGSTGGEATHKITVDEVPSHTHEMPNPDWISGDYVKTWPEWTPLYTASQRSTEISCAPGFTQNTGGNQPHNNMPPYLAVYMWKRVS